MSDFVSFDFEKRSKIDETFRVSKIRSMFDLQNKESIEHFEGKIELPNEWQIGAIVGASGTGKTSIARKIYGDKVDEKFEYTHSSVIDDMPENVSIDEITKTFYAVGFGSVPSWLKPYSVLSNGEKMRVDLANRLLRSDTAIIDEFTSVVDRNVAKTMCIATKKALSKNKSKRLVVISCHYDILDWLQPDWVFDASGQKSFFGTSHDLNSNLKFGEWQNNVGGVLCAITI
jgi:ABC-type ATPase with predicted acetyltransferase domain